MITFLLVLHGVLAANAVVVSILGVQAKAPARIRVLATTLLVAVLGQTVVGDLIYPLYVRAAKPALVALTTGSRSAADIFEVKEHLAFFVLVLTIGVFVTTRGERRQTLVTRVLFGAAHGTIVAVGILGLVVASLKTP